MKRLLCCFCLCTMAFSTCVSSVALSAHQETNHSQPLLSPIVTNKYVYDDTYPSFKKWTDEKEISAQLNQAFSKNLQKLGLVFVGKKPIKIADIASGPADTIIKYFQNISFVPGFDIRATDSNPAYAGSFFAKGQAYHNLLAAKKHQSIPLVNFSVKRGDAFRGHLDQLLMQKGEKNKANTFQIAVFSHGIYHAQSDQYGTTQEKTDRILNDIARNVLDPAGVGIMYHVSFSDQSVQYFRYNYGRKGYMKSKSDTGAVESCNPALSIFESAKKQRIPYYALDFTTRLFFSKKIKSYAPIFKDPTQFAALRSNPEAWEDYQKLSFLAQRASDEMAADKTKTGLNHFIDEALSALKQDDQGRWYMILTEKMQIILNPKASSAFKAQVRRALSDTKHQLPIIQKKGLEAFEKRLSQFKG
jgi:hypothetical protein